MDTSRLSDSGAVEVDKTPKKYYLGKAKDRARLEERVIISAILRASALNKTAVTPLPHPHCFKCEAADKPGDGILSAKYNRAEYKLNVVRYREETITHSLQNERTRPSISNITRTTHTTFLLAPKTLHTTKPTPNPT